MRDDPHEQAVASAGACAAGAAAHHHHHRVTLVLSSGELPASLAFTGSDAWGNTADLAGHSAQGRQDDASGNGTQPIASVARGPWGTFLPVSVVGFEAADEEGGSAHDSSTSTELDVCRCPGLLDTAMRPMLIALTVSVAF